MLWSWIALAAIIGALIWYWYRYLEDRQATKRKDMDT